MAKGRRRRRRARSEFAFVFKLILLVAVIIVIFEGRLIATMVTFHSSDGVAVSSGNVSISEKEEGETESETEKSGNETTVIVTSDDMYLAGLSDAGLPSGVVQTETETETESETEARHDTVSNPDSAAIVREQSDAVDDSYFSNAVFIGDSRMEGFRNTSGITEGTFFTSVGMSLSSMTSSAIISDGEDKITVAAALSGGTYGKIYIMLGANDLGEYDWDDFKSGLISVTNRFMELQPDAILYLCSCIYVEEAKVTTGDYINNENVDILNGILLEVCEEEGYYYLDFNEVLSDGYGSLIAGASSDGVHLSADYCKVMLDYMKTHYVSDTEDAEAQTDGTGSDEDDIETDAGDTETEEQE